MQAIVYYYPEGHMAHAEEGHPERPNRVEAIREALDQSGLWQAYPKLPAQEVSQALLEAVHTPLYLKALQAACQVGAYLDADTYTTPSSWNLARRTAGGALAVAQAVWSGEARRGFALTRPPGHHATAERGMGFCLLNNIALATHSLVQQAGAQRLAIVDIDLHHGNGTQDIFWRRGDVFYLSTHQMPLYPGSGYLDETGQGPGAGATANFPLPPGSGDLAFSNVMNRLILPLLARFKPEMILVSVGFDAHWRDPLGSLLISAQAYGELVAALTAFADQNCGGRIALFLEGGYDLQAGAWSAVASAAALLGQPFEDPFGPSPRPENSEWERMVLEAEKLWGLSEF